MCILIFISLMSNFFIDISAICTFEKCQFISVDHFLMGSLILGKSKFDVVYVL